jgi:hypothetical protein
MTLSPNTSELLITRMRAVGVESAGSWYGWEGMLEHAASDRTIRGPKHADTLFIEAP